MREDNDKLLDEIMKFNKDFVEKHKYEEYRADKIPEKKLVILSCMDTRLTELLPKAMNVRNGDAKIIKNAGATVMHPFGSIARSIIVAIYEFNAKDIMVVGHKGCGMSNLDSKSVVAKIRERGISQDKIDTINSCGIDVHKWLHGFGCVEDSVRESVDIINNHPLVPEDIYVHGLIMDPYTGELEVVVDGYDK